MTLGVFYQNGTVDQGVVAKAFSHTVTSGEDTANSAAITIDGIGNIDAVVVVQVKSTTNVVRVPQGAVTTSGKVLTVADSGLAAGEIISGFVVAFNS